MLPWKQNFWITTKGSLGNNDGDKNGKKSNKFILINNFARHASCFSAHFLAIVAQLRHETS